MTISGNDVTPPAGEADSLRASAGEFFLGLQRSLCDELEKLDGKEHFREDQWSYDAQHHAEGKSGGGRTRVIECGAVFEKGGVNYSSIVSPLTPAIARKLDVEPQPIAACGISLVLHPLSPMVPTVHLNLRYLSLKNGRAWFGGGTDLTPYYFFPDDASHFHQTLRASCDRYSPEAYTRFKRWCDDYFTLPHRKEKRGIGGIFFDYLSDDLGKVFKFVQDIGENFLTAYVPIVRRRMAEPWGEREREWQEVRRGRYVEFNLLYDRGTLFGLETGGRTESILMSLPPRVRWDYDLHPVAGSREAALLEILHRPQSWL